MGKRKTHVRGPQCEQVAMQLRSKRKKNGPQEGKGSDHDLPGTEHSEEGWLAGWLACGPFSLVMSSSFFGFYAHLGVMTALLEAGLRPAKVAGSSAGALVAAAYAAGVDVDEARRVLLKLRRHDLLASWIDRGPMLGVFAAVEDNALTRVLGSDARLEACRVPIAISTFEIATGTTRVFREGPIADVVTASCSVPGLLAPATIAGAPGRYWDGGVRDIAGLAGID